MLRFLASTTLALAVALAGGIGSVWWALQAEERLDAVRVGGWHAHPERGTPAANPYSRAEFIRAPRLALGAAEGIVFDTAEDDAGRPLDASCDYRMSGGVPSARFWTLHARLPDGSLATTALSDRMPALQSRSLLRAESGSFVVAIAGRPKPGNWLAIGTQGPFELVLTLYDAAITSSASLPDLQLPEIERVACHG